MGKTNQPIEIIKSRIIDQKLYLKIKWSNGAKTYVQQAKLTPEAKKLYQQFNKQTPPKTQKKIKKIEIKNQEKKKKKTNRTTHPVNFRPGFISKVSDKKRRRNLRIQLTLKKQNQLLELKKTRSVNEVKDIKEKNKSREPIQEDEKEKSNTLEPIHEEENTSKEKNKTREPIHEEEKQVTKKEKKKKTLEPVNKKEKNKTLEQNHEGKNQVANIKIKGRQTRSRTQVASEIIVLSGNEEEDNSNHAQDENCDSEEKDKEKLKPASSGISAEEEKEQPQRKQQRGKASKKKVSKKIKPKQFQLQEASINFESERDNEINENKNEKELKPSRNCNILKIRINKAIQKVEFMVIFEDDEAKEEQWLDQDALKTQSPRQLCEFLMERAKWYDGK